MMYNIIIPYNTPKVLYLDQQSSHTSLKARQFLKSLNIDTRYILPARHENLAYAENKICQLQTALKFLSRDQVDRWPSFLSLAVSATNKTPSTVTLLSPFQIMFGIEPTFAIDSILQVDTNRNSEDKRLIVLNEYRELVAIRRNEAFEKLKEKVESVHPPTNFLPGTQVMVKRIHTPRGQCSTLQALFDGPFTVIAQLDGNSYLIDFGNNKSRPIPINRLKLYLPATDINSEFKAKYHSFLRSPSHHV